MFVPDFVVLSSNHLAGEERESRPFYFNCHHMSLKFGPHITHMALTPKTHDVIT